VGLQYIAYAMGIRLGAKLLFIGRAMNSFLISVFHTYRYFTQ
jgi:hypothetical protein